MTCLQYDEVSTALKAARMAELLAKDPERAQRMTGKQYFTKNQNATAADLEVREGVWEGAWEDVWEGGGCRVGSRMGWDGMILQRKSGN